MPIRRPVVARFGVSALFAAALLFHGSPADAGTIFGFAGATLGGGSRWDADPLTLNLGGNNYERSLDGGLRYSLETGTYQGYRDMFSWDFLPTVADFTQAIHDAFSAWTVVDPASGLGTAISFVADLGTLVEGTAAGGGVNPRGAEIDLFASIDANLWNPGNNSPQGETFFGAVANPVTLTSGTPNYSNSFSISGADITLNNNPGAVYSLPFFRRLLTHEIGHALGLGDVEGDINPGRFIDDNFDATSSATALATLTNSWAGLVNVFNPAASPLARFTVPFGNPGTTTPGVDILMESRGLGIGATNPIGNLTPLTNDDFGTRQFLYPFVAEVPEPTSLLLLATGVGLFAKGRRRRAY